MLVNRSLTATFVIVSVAVGICRFVVAEERANVIVLLADDLGWTDLGCYGSDSHQTPIIDHLAARAMRFTDAYSSCTVCSPTRASIMTGKYPARLHLTDFIAGQHRPFAKLEVPDWNKRLELSEVTLAEALRCAGYATAQIGKWHLGPRGGADAKNYDPIGQGFDTQRMKPPGTRGYFIPERVVKQRQLKSSYVTDHLTDEAVKVIHDWKDHPFFLYFAYHTPHTPIQGKEELVNAYRKSIVDGAKHINPTYAAMVHSLDESVGRILSAVEESGISKRTIIIFASDNGGLSRKFGKQTGFTVNTPLRQGKGSAYEGGVRVPLIVRWPGVTKAGSTSSEPVCTIDFYPTILEMTATKGDTEHNQTIDGLSLVNLLKTRKINLIEKRCTGITLTITLVAIALMARCERASGDLSNSTKRRTLNCTILKRILANQLTSLKKCLTKLKNFEPCFIDGAIQSKHKCRRPIRTLMPKRRDAWLLAKVYQTSTENHFGSSRSALRFLTKLVQVGVALLALLLCCTHFPQAIRDSLGYPTVGTEKLCKMTSVKRLW